MRQQLVADGELAAIPPLERAVTVVAELLRRVWAPGNAYFAGSTQQLLALIAAGALVREPTGRWRVQPDLFDGVFEPLAAQLLRLQGDGDAVAAAAWCDTTLPADLLGDLARVDAAGVPQALYAENVVDRSSLSS